MTTDVILIAGTIVEHEVVSGMTSTWKRIPRLTEIGAIGEQSDPKEKTTLEDSIKKYDSGLRDAPDKNLKGQYIPTKLTGEKHYDDYVLQQEFITRCRNEEEFNTRVVWPDGDVSAWLHKSLGFEFDQGTQEDWKMFTTNGKQNSRVVYGVSVTGTPTVTVAATTQLTVATIPMNLDTSAGVIYWKSSDEAVATVDANGLVTGVGAGTTDITAEFRGVIGTLEVTVS
tara:strand:+ start:485 stop:1165 length:681 start_codon:yes stop_codon:yes gene_type:complete